MTTKEQLQQELNQLVVGYNNYLERITKGSNRIEENQKQGINVVLWEDHWVELLRQFSQVSEKIRNIKSQLEETEKVG